MRLYSREQAQALLRSQFPEVLFYRYPCDFAESEDHFGISVKINDQPSSIAINNHLDEEYLPNGIYHLNRVSCTCPSPLKKLARQLQSLFTQKITKKNCRVHTKEFDVYLRSNQPLSFRKM